MYSLSAYGSMLEDRVRVDACAQALRKTVRAGSVVVEIGTGPGIFAVLACQLGASRVYAIEPSEIIQVAREVAAANGCADKIEFFEEFSNRVTLPTRADVILSDLRGVLPLFERHIPAIVDARHRFLAPGGTLIPRRDTLWAAIVEAPKPYGEFVDPWEHNSLGQDLSAARQLIVNNSQKVRVSPEQLLTATSSSGPRSTMAASKTPMSKAIWTGGLSEPGLDTGFWCGSMRSWPRASGSPTLPPRQRQFTVLSFSLGHSPCPWRPAKR